VSWKRHLLPKFHWTGGIFDGMVGGMPESPFATANRREERIQTVMRSLPGWQPIPDFGEIGVFSVWKARKEEREAKHVELRAKATAIVDAEDAARRMAEERAAEAAREAEREAAAAEGAWGPIIDGELAPSDGALVLA